MQIEHQWLLLNLIPQYPDKINSTLLKQKLFENSGKDYSLRTIQRELQKLAKVFDLEFDQQHKPYAWRWKQGKGLQAKQENTGKLPKIDLGLASLSEKITLEAYFYHDLKNSVTQIPLGSGQTIRDYDEQWFLLQADVVLNQELIQWLLACGDRVEVVAPESLRNWLATSLANSYGYYFDES